MTKQLSVDSNHTVQNLSHSKYQFSVVGSWLSRYGMFLVLLVLCLVFSFVSPYFLKTSNLMDVIRQVSVVGVIAAGQTLVILTAGIDLSVGSVAGLAGAITAGTLVHSNNTVIGIVAGLVIGATIGLINGLLITKVKLTPFIVTLATMTLVSGCTLVFTNGNPIVVTNNAFEFIGAGYVGPLPFPVILLILFYALALFVLRKTVHGQYLYAIGGNEKATVLAGIPVNFHKTIAYVTSGGLAGVAGIILTARLTAATPTAGSGYELDAIAAVILGGTSLFGGKGGVLGTLVGALLLGVLEDGMNLANISAFYQGIAKGLIILIAVIIDRLINIQEQH